MRTSVPILAAFVAGFLSFISPSAVTLIPGYIAFVAGAVRKERGLITSFCLVSAFSLMLVALGASATWVGAFMSRHKELLGMIAGGILVLYGVYATGFMKIRTYGLDAVLVGIAFAFGWTPVGGPILGALLTIGAAPESGMTGAWLLTAYAFGLAIPFVLTALAVDQVVASGAGMRGDELDLTPRVPDDGYRYDRAIEIASGAALIVMGALMLTGRFPRIARSLGPYLPTF